MGRGAELSARAQTQKEIDRLTVEIDRLRQTPTEVQGLQQELQKEFRRASAIVDGW